MNFSCSDSWNYSIILRYPADKIIKMNKIYFYNDDNSLKCQHFFDFNVSNLELEMMKIEILKGRILRFNYINDSNLLKKLKQWSNKEGFIFKYVDKWKAPQLILKTSIKQYLKENKHSQVRRNYRLYEKEKVKYKFYNSSNNDILKLWNYVLDIDFHSWKNIEHSDMKSLNREDLQYLPFLLTNKNSSNLVVVCDLNDYPLAYSLMFKNEDDIWYAVKWGSSDEGRTKYAGIFALFNHLEYLYSLENKLNLDFWGRRNKVYDDLKNNDIVRSHIEIYKEVE